MARLSHEPIAQDYLSDLICDALVYRQDPAPIGQLATSIHPELLLPAELVEKCRSPVPAIYANRARVRPGLPFDNRLRSPCFRLNS